MMTEAQERRRNNKTLFLMISVGVLIWVIFIAGCASTRYTRVVINGENVVETGETNQFPWVIGESHAIVRATMVDDHVTSASVEDVRSKSVLESLGLAGIAVGAAAVSGGAAVP